MVTSRADLLDRAKRITVEVVICGAVSALTARVSVQIWWAYRVHKFLHDIEHDRRAT
jgi:hypothetical protein